MIVFSRMVEVFFFSWDPSFIIKYMYVAADAEL